MRFRLSVFFVVLALIATSCSSGGSAGGATEAPECVVNATALAKLTENSPSLRPDDGGRVRTGTIAPDFALCDADGNVVQLSALEGQPVLLIFWASWCPFCAVELPTLDVIAKQLPSNLVVLTVATLDDPQAAWNDYREKGYQFQTVFDTANTVSDRYSLRGVPLAIFIDADGIVVGQIYGEAHFDKDNCFRQLERFARGEVSSIVTAYCRR